MSDFCCLFLPYSDISFMFVVKEAFDNCQVDSIRNKDFNFYLISGALLKRHSLQENDSKHFQNSESFQNLSELCTLSQKTIAQDHKPMWNT